MSNTDSNANSQHSKNSQADSITKFLVEQASSPVLTEEAAMQELIEKHGLGEHALRIMEIVQTTTRLHTARYRDVALPQAKAELAGLLDNTLPELTGCGPYDIAMALALCKILAANSIITREIQDKLLEFCEKHWSNPTVFSSAGGTTGLSGILSHIPLMIGCVAFAAPSGISAKMQNAMPTPAFYSKNLANATSEARYLGYEDNALTETTKESLSTFSLNVGTASYANVRRFLNSGSLPNPDAVRVEELLNYFPANRGNNFAKMENSPFYGYYSLFPCPWNSERVLMHLALLAEGENTFEGRVEDEIPPCNLVFLVDTSGSMEGSDRLALVKAGLNLLIDELRPADKVSLVTYSGTVSIPFSNFSGDQKVEMRAAINSLIASGCTAGGEAMKLAYEQAKRGFVKNGVNRILMFTDGDFNVGVSSNAELTALVARKRDTGITLSILGFGGYNLNDSMMVQVADKGNGNYSYIDSLSEAHKVFTEELRATLTTVAKDVKAQIEFNPVLVKEYRQIGYDTRQLEAAEFNDDNREGGFIGSGKLVNALYELTLVGQKTSVDPLRYATPTDEAKKDASSAKNGEANGGNGSGEAAEVNFADELAFVKLRWKAPEAKNSTLTAWPVFHKHLHAEISQANADSRFIAAVAAFGQKLRNNPALAETSWPQIAALAQEAVGTDPGGYKNEFVKLVKLADKLAKH